MLDGWGEGKGRHVHLEDLIVDLVELDVVFVEVGEEGGRAEDFGDLDELVVVVRAVEEGVFAEDLQSNTIEFKRSCQW